MITKITDILIVIEMPSNLRITWLRSLILDVVDGDIDGDDPLEPCALVLDGQVPLRLAPAARAVSTLQPLSFCDGS